jgi:hypothetical protein
VIQVRELLSADAMRRYDDNGEPAYTSYERVLLCLRWFDWASTERMFEALGMESSTGDERDSYWSALNYYVKAGKIEKRTNYGVKEYRLVAPSKRVAVTVCRRCSSEVVPGYVLCDRHLEWQRKNKNARQQRPDTKPNRCGLCSELGHKRDSCVRRAA